MAAQLAAAGRGCGGQRAAHEDCGAPASHSSTLLPPSFLQIVVFCPNAGLLSGIVLSLVPLLLPFHWQCLLLPVLPAGEGRLELMEVGLNSAEACRRFAW